VRFLRFPLHFSVCYFPVYRTFAFRLRSCLVVTRALLFGLALFTFSIRFTNMVDHTHGYDVCVPFFAFAGLPVFVSRHWVRFTPSLYAFYLAPFHVRYVLRSLPFLARGPPARLRLRTFVCRRLPVRLFTPFRVAHAILFRCCCNDVYLR